MNTSSSGPPLREGQSSTSRTDTHSLSFRVMRLCHPSMSVDLPLKFDSQDHIWLAEDADPTTNNAAPSPIPHIFSNRCHLSHPSDAFGLNGIMLLPQSFGSIHLGETFRSYVSVGNHSKFGVSNVIVKAELQTDRQRIVLADNSKTPVEVLDPGGHEDFIIQHDIKELGGHTLICLATYFDHNGEHKTVPQFFKFTASNPISVKTKVRSVKKGVEESTFLEACIENNTKGPLFLDDVKFESTNAWKALLLDPEEEGTPRCNFRKANLISPNGGSRHFLYQLAKAPSDSSISKPDSGNSGSVLGKLEIRWRSTMGESGKLQTQQILGTPVAKKDVELRLLDVPRRIRLEQPFLLQCSVANFTDRIIGPLHIVTCSSVAGNVTPVCATGLWSLVVDSLEAHSKTDFSVSLVALSPGVQRISGISVQDGTHGKPYDTLPPTEVYVEL